MMDIKTAVAKLDELQKIQYAYSHAMGIVFYDAVTTAPKDTAEGRGVALGILSGEMYRKFINPEVDELLTFLSGNMSELDDHRKREVELLKKDFDRTKKIPENEFVEYQMLLNEADSVWHKAKEEDDFESFRPCLEKIVAFNRKMAAYYDPEKDAYDVLLDLYEEGLTQETADAFFLKLRERIVPLLEEIMKKDQIDDSFLYGHFDINAQRQFSDYLMEKMCIDRSHCGIGETEHPFTTNFNKKDVRITTNYHEDNAVNSMFSVVHEGGHALYELGSGDEHEYTAVAGGVSMGIHESQSRFFENIIGRSRPFVKNVLPKLKELFPEQFRTVTAEQLYRAVNKVEPGLIRIDADELTYSLHIMVRYELEKQLIKGTLEVKDLPDAWAAKMKEYLGVDVPDDKRGCLQDSHWSSGSFGYFPSYALGSAYGAQILKKMEEHFDVYKAVEDDDLSPIVAWLTEHIWQYGKMYAPGALLEKCVGAPFDPQYYVDYLETKFKDLYSID